MIWKKGIVRAFGALNSQMFSLETLIYRFIVGFFFAGLIGSYFPMQVIFSFVLGNKQFDER